MLVGRFLEKERKKTGGLLTPDVGTWKDTGA